MNNLPPKHQAIGPAPMIHPMRLAPLVLVFLPVWLGTCGDAFAGTSLQNVEFAALPGNRVQIDLVLSGAIKPPEAFSTESPSRIALDFPGVTSALDKKTVPVGVGVVHSVVAVEGGDRTRVVINLNESVPYEVTTRGNRVTVAVNTQEAATPTPPQAQPQPEPGAQRQPQLRPQAGGPASTARTAPRAAASLGSPLRDIDFRRGNTGEGKVVIKLPSATTRVAVREQGQHVLVDLFDTALPQRLFRRLDVADFATPVTSVESKPKGRDVEVDIQAAQDYDYLAYQTDDTFTLEFRKLTKAEKDEHKKKDVVYSGDRLSLNFQDIEVRAVLQLLADFTGLNLVASDTVGGNITLRLKNVPWDQALDIILKTKGLTMRQAGNVVMIAPTPEVAAQDKLELESQQQMEELAPLRSEFVQVNYAKAGELAAVLKSEENKILSERGAVTFDKRTNSLLVKDTAANLEDIRRVVGRLDVPVRQVMIESRIVIATNDFARDLGVRFGLAFATGSLSDNQLTMAGTRPGGAGITDYNAGRFGLTNPDAEGVVKSYSPIIQVPADSGNQGLLVNLPAPTPSGAVNFLIGKVGSYLLQLELSAMQKEGRGEIVSNPRVITSDQSKATIKVGKEIPYQENAGGVQGGTTTAFKEAALKLEVTPSITPDDRIIMDLKVNKDDPDFAREVQGVPPINTREVKTSVLVDNGETVVLGGVYERTKSFTKEQVPWLGEIPILGNLFKTTSKKDVNEELLIFVTPKILKSDLVTR
jgi:type IV pilus assembly protein PilQ